MAKKKGAVSAFEPRGKKKVPGKGRLIAAVIIIFVAAYFVVSGLKIIKLNNERQEAEARKQELLNTKEDLLAQYETINSAQYIERLARRDLKLVKSNELLFILPDDPIETETPQEEEDGQA